MHNIISWMDPPIYVCIKCIIFGNGKKLEGKEDCVVISSIQNENLVCVCFIELPPLAFRLLPLPRRQNKWTIIKITAVVITLMAQRVITVQTQLKNIATESWVTNKKRSLRLTVAIGSRRTHLKRMREVSA